MAKTTEYVPGEVKKIRQALKKGSDGTCLNNRSTRAVKILKSRLGWTKGGLQKKYRLWTEHEDRLLIRWRQRGFTNTVIADGLGRTYGAVKQRASKLLYQY